MAGMDVSVSAVLGAYRAVYPWIPADDKIAGFETDTADPIMELTCKVVPPDWRHEPELPSRLRKPLPPGKIMAPDLDDMRARWEWLRASNPYLPPADVVMADRGVVVTTDTTGSRITFSVYLGTGHPHVMPLRQQG